MIDPVESRAKRILARGKLKGYKVVQSAEPWAGLPPEAGELLGTYVNTIDNVVLVAKIGIVTRQAQETVFIRYADIIEASVLNSDKHQASEIELTVPDGIRHRILIAHGEGRLRDIWEFFRFLDRVRRDLQGATETATLEVNSNTEK